MNIESLTINLLKLDRDIGLKFPNCAERLNCYIVGSSALIFQGLLHRDTGDVDVMNASAEILKILPKYNINSQVTAFADHFTDSYIDRAVPLSIGARYISFYTAAIEDMIASKLASCRDKDWNDITQPAVLKAVDPEKLKYVIEEVSIDMLSDLKVGEFKCRADNYLELLYNTTRTSLF